MGASVSAFAFLLVDGGVQTIRHWLSAISSALDAVSVQLPQRSRRSLALLPGLLCARG